MEICVSQQTDLQQKEIKVILMKILILILTIIITFIITFTVTFTIITFYITSNRRVRPKYHFTGIADLREAPDTCVNKNETFSPVDSESAIREWERANHQG